MDSAEKPERTQVREDFEHNPVAKLTNKNSLMGQALRKLLRIIANKRVMS